MTVNQWITLNYEELATVSVKVNSGKGDSDDLLHYAIEAFITNPKAQGLVDAGHAKWFIIRILNTSAKSKTSGFWREHRNDHAELVTNTIPSSEDYDADKDIILEWLAGIMEDMKHDDISNWYRATILELCLNQTKLNFSELSRKTGIPRTSLSNAYHEGIEWVKTKINEYGTNYPDFSNSLLSYINNKP
jgi:hypothetical protein